MTSTPDDAPRGFVPMREYLKLQRRCDELEAQLADRQDGDLTERVTELQLRALLNCAPQAALAIREMLRSPQRPVSRATLELAITRGAGVLDIHHVPAVLSKLNGKMLDEYGVRLTRGLTLPPYGYELTPEGRAWLEANIPELFAKGASR